MTEPRLYVFFLSLKQWKLCCCFPTTSRAVNSVSHCTVCGLLELEDVAGAGAGEGEGEGAGAGAGAG